MIRYKRHSIGGTYSPSFLTMYIETQENLEKILTVSYPDELEAAFLHEYVHLLQDMTTLSGLNNISRVVDYLKWATNKQKTGNLIVPCMPTQQDGYNLKANLDLSKVALGSGEANFKLKSINAIYPKYETIMVDRRWVKLELSAIMEVVSENDSILEYFIGEYAISESMAYFIESISYPGMQSDLNDLPYRVVEMISEEKITGAKNEPLKLIALCDGCLQHSFPGKTLLKALEELKDVFLDMSPEEIYDYVVSDAFLKIAIPGIKGTFKEHLDRSFLSAQQQMIDYFTTHQYKNMIEWVKQMFDDAYKLRSQNPHFMINIARQGKILNNLSFNQAVNAIGCPVIMNQKNEMTYIRNNNINFEVTPPTFNVIEQIYSIFSRNKLGAYSSYQCKLVEWCRNDFAINNLPDLTGEYQSKCLYSPWERISTKELQQCYFGQVWYTWGLKDVVPVQQ